MYAAVAVTACGRGFPTGAVKLGTTSLASLPPGWTTVAERTSAQTVELVRKRASPQGDIVEGDLVITVEIRRDHADALRRLRSIAAEQPVAPTFETIDGWPALERQQVVPMPETAEADRVGKPGDNQHRQLSTITVAVAASDRLVRAEGGVASEVDAAVGREIATIAHSMTFSARADPAQTAQELAELRGAAPGPAAPPPPPPGPPGGPAPGAATVGAAALSEVGVGELEVAVSNSGAGFDNVVVATNAITGSTAGVAFSSNGGVTFSASTFSPGFGHDGDPSLATGNSKNFYLAFIGFPAGETAAGGVSGCSDSVSVSADGGKTFNFRSHAVFCPATGSPQCFPDQEHIAADQVNASASSQDQVYVVWRNFTPSSGTNCPQRGNETPGIVCSTDGGTTWPTQTLFGAGGDRPRATVAGDGSVWVVYRAGGNVEITKFSSCTGGLVQQPGFPQTVASITDPPCPMPGLERCLTNQLASAMVAVDHTNNNHIFVAWAASNGTGNDDVFVADSTDGGATWPRTVRVNQAVTARRFYPWLCTIGGTAHVTWYDRRAAATGTDDLTAYFRGSAQVSGGALTAGTEVPLSGKSDPQCASGWSCGEDNAADGESCTAQPQLAGNCQNSSGGGSQQPCDINQGPPCPAGETCQANGAPCTRHGDYNGNACGASHVYAAWASATPPTGVTAPAGLNVYVDGIACSDVGQPCCGGTACKSGLLCDASGICTCGGKAQPCCGGTGCSPGLVCATSGSGTTCQCGDLAQPCCGDTCNSSDLVCNSSFECISACGHQGQECCHSAAGVSPPSHTGTAPGFCLGGGGTCIGDTCECGGKDQPCCLEPPGSCGTGLSCANLICLPPGGNGGSGGGTCAQCSTAFTTCLNGCKTDPAHRALCDCLCQNTECDCFHQRSCNFCTFQSCTGL